MNKKRILITGASGFIGSTIVDKALNLGYETWAGIRENSSKQYLNDERTRFIDLAYNDKRRLREQVKSLANEGTVFDYVVHVAGATKVVRKDDFYRINYEYTRNLVEALIEEDAIPASFVLMSSLSSLGVGDETGYTPISDDQPANPNTEYGKSKLKAEQYLRKLDGFPYIIIRPTGVYGPRDSDYFLLMKAIQRGLSAGVGYRKQVLSFIYSEDLADSIFMLLDKGITGQSFIVADGDYHTDAEFNDIVKEALGRKHVLRLKFPLSLVRSVAYISEKICALMGKPSTLNSDKYHILKQRNWACDITPIQEAVGFEPKYRLREGVHKTVAWYREQGWL